jgi:hypothetical protein
VGVVWSAFSGDQPRDPLLVEDGLRLIERRAREPKRLGRPRHGPALDIHPAEHFVLHLQEIAPIEKVVRGKQRILHVLGPGMERAMGAQGIGLGIAARSGGHSQCNYAAYRLGLSSPIPTPAVEKPIFTLVNSVERAGPCPGGS